MTHKLKTIIAAAIMVANTIILPVSATSATSGSSVYLPDGKYFFRNKNSKYLNAHDFNVETSGNYGWEYNEIYISRDYKTNFYTLRGVWSGKNIDAYGAGTTSGTNIVTWEPNDTCAQKWAIDDDGNGYYIFRNACSGLALDVYGASDRSGVNIQLWEPNGTNAQKWELIRNENIVANRYTNDKAYYIKSDVTIMAYPQHVGNMVLDINGASRSNGANAQIWNYNFTPAQYFKFEKNSDGSVRIKYPFANKSLDVSGAGRHNGANVQLWENNNTCAQKWFIMRDAFHGTEGFINGCSGKMLDVSGAGMNAGTNVHIWEVNGTVAQEWAIIQY